MDGRGVLRGSCIGNQMIRYLTSTVATNLFVKSTYHRPLPNRSLYQSLSLLKGHEKLRRLFRHSGYSPFLFHSSGTSGTIDFPQLSTSFCSRSSTADADGRLLDSGPSSTTQVATSSFHNVPENPEAGREGRSPLMTLYITL